MAICYNLANMTKKYKIIMICTVVTLLLIGMSLVAFLFIYPGQSTVFKKINGIALDKPTNEEKEKQAVIDENISLIKIPNSWKIVDEHTRQKSSSGFNSGTPITRSIQTYDVSRENFTLNDLQGNIDRLMVQAGFQKSICTQDGDCGEYGSNYGILDSYYVKKVTIQKKCTLHGETSINPIWEYTPEYEQDKFENAKKPPQQVVFQLQVGQDCY